MRHHTIDVHADGPCENGKYQVRTYAYASDPRTSDAEGVPYEDTTEHDTLEEAVDGAKADAEFYVRAGHAWRSVLFVNGNERGVFGREPKDGES